jgi:hypothetical protein
VKPQLISLFDAKWNDPPPDFNEAKDAAAASALHLLSCKSGVAFVKQFATDTIEVESYY